MTVAEIYPRLLSILALIKGIDELHPIDDISLDRCSSSFRPLCGGNITIYPFSNRSLALANFSVSEEIKVKLYVYQNQHQFEADGLTGAMVSRWMKYNEFTNKYCIGKDKMDDSTALNCELDRCGENFSPYILEHLFALIPRLTCDQEAVAVYPSIKVKGKVVDSYTISTDPIRFVFPNPEIGEKPVTCFIANAS